MKSIQGWGLSLCSLPRIIQLGEPRVVLEVQHHGHGLHRKLCRIWSGTVAERSHGRHGRSSGRVLDRRQGGAPDGGRGPERTDALGEHVGSAASSPRGRGIVAGEAGGPGDAGHGVGEPVDDGDDVELAPRGRRVPVRLGVQRRQPVQHLQAARHVAHDGERERRPVGRVEGEDGGYAGLDAAQALV